MVTWFPLVERKQILQCSSVNFGGEENVTERCVTWDEEREALPRVGV